MEPLFVKEHIQNLRPYIQKTVDDLLGAMIAGGCDDPVDLVEKFALPVPSYVSFPGRPEPLGDANIVYL